ncbi:hypothetical protein GCM10028801_28320 [Nocardioides maradonensis]
MTLTQGSTDAAIKQYAATPAWLVQYAPASADSLLRRWEAGEDFEYPAVNRHSDDIRLDHFVIFWRSGASDTAGVVGWGVTSGVVEEREHARSYHEPDGPRALRDSVEVALACVFDEPILTRAEMKQLPEFADFELFQMPNRPNAFAVSRAQWGVILRRLEEVLGR